MTDERPVLRLPHPIPYQGSKRNLEPLIGRYVPADVETWFEPFARSAAMSLWAAANLSYDGSCGTKVYGPPLPDDLGMTRLHLHAGRSSQATLNGTVDETVESLYLSQGLAEPTADVLGLPRRGTRQTEPPRVPRRRFGV